MLDFETCMKLKDAGFPQSTLELWAKSPNGKTTAVLPCHAFSAIYPNWEAVCAHPHLGELLRACLPRFRTLIFIEQLRSWSVYSYKARTKYKLAEIDANSPEKALALLYLELYKKNQLNPQYAQKRALTPEKIHDLTPIQD